MKFIINKYLVPVSMLLGFLVLVTTNVVSARNCLNPDNAITCSKSGTCIGDKDCECFPGYEGQWCETCKNCDKKCDEIRGCLECKLYDSGPTKHAGKCDDCGFMSASLIGEKTQFDPNRSILSNNGSCQIVDDSGCDLKFWFGHDKKSKLMVWSDKNSRVCPPSEEQEVAEACKKKTTCTECEGSPGCGWCSNPDKEINLRCNSIKETKKSCPSSRLEKKFSGSPTVIRETREQKFKYDWIQLRPQAVELVMNVGDIKYLNFTYMFISNGITIRHDFPENIEVEIYSTCGGKSKLKKVAGCYGILNGNTVQFHARFRLKYCSLKASEWQNKYKLTLSEENVLEVDFKAFCSCSCDKFTTDGACRNDRKTYLDLNPCGKKDSCSDCLKDTSCNWCSSSKYSYLDGSPLPRCNNDHFFIADLCPIEGRMNPPKALTDCSNCEHTCSGGICSENKKELLQLNTCVSQLTCGDCMQARGCAWCSATDGATKCNKISNWIARNQTVQKPGQVQCQGNIFGDGKISNDMIDYFGNGGSHVNYASNPEFLQNTLDITMKVGETYKLKLIWNIKADKQNINPSFWKSQPTISNIELNLNSKNEKSLSFLKLKYDFECNGRPCSKTDILSDMDKLVSNVFLELSECKEEEMTNPVYLGLIRNGADHKYPYGVIRINIGTICSCSCEQRCSNGFEKNHSSCTGGNLNCGVCQDCPDGSFGEFCQCSQDGTEREPSHLKALPSIVVGEKDDLIGKFKKAYTDEISFSHAILPIDVSPDSLKCNKTYCMNTNSQECYAVDNKKPNFDIIRAANLITIYGDNRLLPGAELVFKITYCPLKLSYWGTHESRFGFGIPPTKTREYKLPKKSSFDAMGFFSDETRYWEVKSLIDSKLQKVSYRNGAWPGGNYGFSHQSPQGVLDSGYLGYINQKIDSDVKLVVTDTEVIWSWEGFKEDNNPDWTELRQKMDIKEKEYFPLFVLPGCEDDGDFSSVTIISSKVGKA